MRGTRAKRIRNDVRRMIQENPDMWSKYPFKKLVQNAKTAWMNWSK